MTDIAMALPLTEKTSNSSLGGQNEKRAHCITSTMEPELPPNFGEVVKGIYRSSFPHPCNLPALEQLGLKTILTLVDEPYTACHANFLRENGIAHFRIPVIANKDPAAKTPDHIMVRILEALLNKSNHPILVHCNKGKHRTGCVIGCFRKVQGWETGDILREYLNYSWPKSRVLDERFIETFDTSNLVRLARISGAKLWQPTSPSEKQDHRKNSSKNLVHSSHGVKVS
ncbi:hypothetical protein EYZ11_011716 [Aspergillus tanneri]|uniref:diphosphoinositol-polyphosphate diphosphatase n=1 Tax=Aspergillus tanneri TaxID=1220188 RepID=A0A4S3J2N2_9EURO|nr:uncharacterized protein ATNIH1004_005035 [Aspergillus tanneri]KAA8649140.1 hypothetical protein ATNIH1004_005035 [Aspergillus tanneri]THC88832.1 hypothetical protein EYZ11_011716 [Aspergillus tanneri]